MRLYLLRHGETEYSRTGGFCGSLDPDLTAVGTQMASEFARTYQTLSWEAVYTSPMRRTLATAAPLCGALNITPRRRDGLREIHYGAWENLTQADALARYPDEYARWSAEPAWNAPPDGETGAEVAVRASAVIDEIVRAHPSGNVLVVTHKATVRLVLCDLLGIDRGRYRDRLAAPTASVSIVSFGPHGPLLETIADRSHLSAELRALPGT